MQLRCQEGSVRKSVTHRNCSPVCWAARHETAWSQKYIYSVWHDDCKLWPPEQEEEEEIATGGGGGGGLSTISARSTKKI